MVPQTTIALSKNGFPLRYVNTPAPCLAAAILMAKTVLNLYQIAFKPFKYVRSQLSFLFLQPLSWQGLQTHKYRHSLHQGRVGGVQDDVFQHGFAGQQAHVLVQGAGA